MSEATDSDLTATDWCSQGAHVLRGDYSDEGEPHVWITVESAEFPATLARHIAVTLNAAAARLPLPGTVTTDV